MCAVRWMEPCRPRSIAGRCERISKESSPRSSAISGGLGYDTPHTRAVDNAHPGPPPVMDASMLIFCSGWWVGKKNEMGRAGRGASRQRRAEARGQRLWRLRKTRARAESHGWMIVSRRGKREQKTTPAGSNPQVLSLTAAQVLSLTLM